ncbi:MAG: 1-deoxy-D-xylulose-5-phosphate synthase N-terminal domain-containing protein [bacterium]
MKYTRSTIYRDFLSLVYTRKIGHIGSCLSVLDILLAIYFHLKKRGDRVLLSKGHAAPALYIVLAANGVLSKQLLATFHANGTTLPMHIPHAFIKNEIPFASGSLGHGLSLSAGMAHANKLQKRKGNIYCIMSDGECNEGQVWEAAAYAAQNALNNLIVFIDVNHIQAFGKTKDVLGEVTAEKWYAFGWNTYECNGHSIKDIVKTTQKIKSSSDKPTVILCDTIKGFNLSFFENTIESHYLPLTEKQYLQGLKKVKSL